MRGGHMGMTGSLETRDTNDRFPMDEKKKAPSLPAGQVLLKEVFFPPPAHS
jgi:hypothetical protein